MIAQTSPVELLPRDRPIGWPWSTPPVPPPWRRLVRASKQAGRLGRRRRSSLSRRNDRFTIEAYLGPLQAGHAVALLDGQLPRPPRSASSTPRLAWMADPQASRPRWRRAGSPWHSRSVDVGADPDRLPGGMDLYPDLAVLLATSGTTGSRKFVGRRDVTS
jgi:hypothetical protein